MISCYLYLSWSPATILKVNLSLVFCSSCRLFGKVNADKVLQFLMWIDIKRARLIVKCIWGKVFKNGPYKICGRQPFKNRSYMVYYVPFKECFTVCLFFMKHRGFVTFPHKRLLNPVANLDKKIVRHSASRLYLSKNDQLFF